MNKRTFTLEEIESELLFDKFFGGETMLQRRARDEAREGWLFTVYPAQREDEATVYAQRGGRTYLRVLRAPFMGGYLEGATQGWPVTGVRARELVARLEERIGSPFPWV